MTWYFTEYVQRLDISTHTLRGERDEVGGIAVNNKTISTHTLRGERDEYGFEKISGEFKISTHTLRGERDSVFQISFETLSQFQLTRSVGSVTIIPRSQSITIRISTHTLRGERDLLNAEKCRKLCDFNSHAPWGA